MMISGYQIGQAVSCLKKNCAGCQIVLIPMEFRTHCCLMMISGYEIGEAVLCCDIWQRDKIVIRTSITVKQLVVYMALELYQRNSPESQTIRQIDGFH